MPDSDQLIRLVCGFNVIWFDYTRRLLVTELRLAAGDMILVSVQHKTVMALLLLLLIIVFFKLRRKGKAPYHFRRTKNKNVLRLEWRHMFVKKMCIQS